MTHSTLIFGNGPCAQSAAQYLLEQGHPVILATREADLHFQRPASDTGTGELEWLGGVRLNACQRDRAACLSLEFFQDKAKIRREVQEIIIAEETASLPCFDSYPLMPGERALTVGEVLDRLGDESANPLPWGAGDSVLLLNGVNQESHPLITRRVLEAALKLQGDHGIQTYLLTRNLKVAAAGLERLVHQARQSGVMIIKISTEMPAMVPLADGGLQLTLLDEITGESYTLALQGAVVDEALQPASYLAELGAVLELESNPDGFLQGENVHRLTCGTNRPAIRVAGPARGILSLEAQIADGRIAAAAGIGPEDQDPYPQVGLADIVQGLCVRCLTCYRLCPYRAIALNERERVFVREAECRKCGICAAECPRGAITLAGLKPGEMARALAAPAGEQAVEAGEAQEPPLIYLFGCSRSAQPAAELVRCLGRPLPAAVKMVIVPCAGALSREHIWAAFAQGAKGVMVFACHPGNCHSEQGTRLAQQRIDQLKVVLAELGIDPRRLAVYTLAANMGAEFAAWVAQFVETLNPQAELKDPVQTA